jgi:hypothetical protein
MTIWLSAWLCGQRHLAFGFAWDDDPTLAKPCTREIVEGAGLAMMQKLVPGLRDRCGICGFSIAPETYNTPFADIPQAERVLAVLQAEQMVGRAVLELAGLTVDGRTDIVLPTGTTYVRPGQVNTEAPNQPSPNPPERPS